MLNTRLTFDQGVAVCFSGDSLKDRVEQRRIEAADVAQSHGRAGLQRLVELWALAALAVPAEVLNRVKENGKQVVDGLEGGELLACRVGLGTDVLKRLAGVEAHDVVLVGVLAVA